MKTSSSERNRGLKGDALLKKWLHGDITSQEELEMFEIADSDEILKDALEGYIADAQIESARLSGYARESFTAETNGMASGRLKSLLRQRYAAASVAIIIALGLSVMLIRTTGEMAEPALIGFDDGSVQQIPIRPIIGHESSAASNVQGSDDAIVGIGAGIHENGALPSHPELIRNTAGNTVGIGPDQFKDTQDQNAGPVARAGADHPAFRTIDETEGRLDDGVVGLNNHLPLVPSMPEVILMEGDHNVKTTGGGSDEGEAIALQFFNRDADEALMREVQMEAIREGDAPLTSYEINIQSGTAPGAFNETEPRSTSGTVDMVGLQSKANLVNASSASNTDARTNTIAGNVVITEYKIQKHDITHPPVEDYNSLVRERYRHKAKPDIGFFQFKKFLKETTHCLVRGSEGIDDLEEAIIKFRVFNNGGIEFIELFGSPSGGCVDQISADITNGPKWELAEHYESIDIEVPFKVLYPYWY